MDIKEVLDCYLGNEPVWPKGTGKAVFGRIKSVRRDEEGNYSVELFDSAAEYNCDELFFTRKEALESRGALSCPMDSFEKQRLCLYYKNHMNAWDDNACRFKNGTVCLCGRRLEVE